MSTIDIDNDELESLMAELEAQNAQIAIESDTTPSVVIEAEEQPVVEAKIEPVIKKAEPVIEAEPAFDPADLDELESIQNELEPTKVDKLNAEQAVQVEEVFSKAEAVDVKVSPTVVEPEPIAEVVAEPIAEVKKEATPDPKAEPIAEATLEPRKLNIEPKPATAKPRSEKSIEDAFTLKLQPDINQFQLHTKITDATLDQCMQDQASLMAYHSALHAQAEAQLAKVKQKFSILEAGLYNAYRKFFAKEGEKVTEKAIENAVRLDTKWASAHLLMIEAQTYADIHKGFVASLRDRRDMLIQRGADRREEMKGQSRTLTTLDVESPVNRQAKVESNSMASKAMELARASMARTA